MKCVKKKFKKSVKNCNEENDKVTEDVVNEKQPLILSEDFKVYESKNSLQDEHDQKQLESDSKKNDLTVHGLTHEEILMCDHGCIIHTSLVSHPWCENAQTQTLIDEGTNCTSQKNVEVGLKSKHGRDIHSNVEPTNSAQKIPDFVHLDEKDDEDDHIPTLLELSMQCQTEDINELFDKYKL